MSLLPAFLSIEENCINTVYALLELLKPRVVKASISTQLKEHPDYPSLLSISDTLNTWKIDNISIRATADQLPDIPLPFIAQLTAERGNVFATVKSFGAEKVVISSAGLRKWQTIDHNTFIDKWTGVVMAVEPMENAGESGYALKKRQSRVRNVITLLAVAMVLLLCGNCIWSALFDKDAIISIPLFILQLLGCYITGLLLWYEVDKHNPSLQFICNWHKHTNCDAVLQSKAAKLWEGVISWSELGFFYFSGSFLALLIGGLHGETVRLQGWLSLLALPYVIFSVYYQWRIARNWCVLCLLVQGVLLATALLAGDFFTASIHTQTFLLQLGCFIAAAIAWLLLKPLLLKAKEGEHNKTALARLKHNPQIFESLLLKQKRISHDITGLGIVLGNTSSNNRIVKVCNPYCGPCARSHAMIEELLLNNPDLQLQIIFTATNAAHDSRAAPVKHLLALAEKNDETLTRQALHDWYATEVKDYNAFSKKYVMNGELTRQGEKLDAMHHWCEQMEVSYTPTFFVNGYQLPAIYSINELKYFFSK